MANLFITGSRGFLGTRLTAAMINAGHTVTAPTSKECDLTQPDSLLPYQDDNFDLIFHLAAWTQAGDFCLRHPGEQWIINQQLNTNVLTWWKEHQPQAKLVSMGTSCAYAPDLELNEENYLEGRPIESLFTYAMTKRMLYAGLLAFKKQFGLESLTLVPATLYGPGYHTDGRQMHFIFDLIRKILRGKHVGDSVVLWGDGQQCREIVHVDDFVRIAQQLVEVSDHDLVNIGAGEEFPIRQFAELISEIVGYDASEIQYDTSRYVGARSKTLGVERLQQTIPDYELRPLRQGLEETVQWFLEHRETFLAEAAK